MSITIGGLRERHPADTAYKRSFPNVSSDVVIPSTISEKNFLAKYTAPVTGSGGPGGWRLGNEFPIFGVKADVVNAFLVTFHALCVEKDMLADVTCEHWSDVPVPAHVLDKVLLLAEDLLTLVMVTFERFLACVLPQVDGEVELLLKRTRTVGA